MNDDWFTGQVLDKAFKSNFDTILFSSEHIFGNLYPVLETVNQIREKYHFELILFVRNPIEAHKSAFQQLVKRYGYHGTVQELGPTGFNDLSIAEKIVRKCNELDIKINIRNYSICRKNLIHVFSHLVQPNEKLELVYDLPGRVSRSLSKFELELQRQLNEKLEIPFRPFISDYFVNELPDIQEADIILDEKTQQKIIARQRDSLEYLNGHLPANEQLNFEVQSSKDNRSENEYTVSSEQIAIVANYMAGNFGRLQAKLDRLQVNKEKQDRKNNEPVIQVYGKRLFVFNPDKLKNSIVKRLRRAKCNPKFD
jgi:hypothetical protein